MNNTSKIVGYTGIFCAAFGTFFYLSYTEKNTTEAGTTDQAVEHPSLSVDNHSETYDAQVGIRSTIEHAEVSSAALPRDTTDNDVLTEADTETDRYASTTSHDISAEMIDYAASAGSIDALQYDRTSEYQTFYTETSENDSQGFTASSPASSVNFTTASIDSSSNTLFSQSSEGLSVTDDLTSGNAADGNETSSDGSEFLPDGSSQEDLFISNSKAPRKYTIADYQQADISCDQSYDGTNGHGTLIRDLKGC
jgi:hypothetical protein